MNKQRLDGDFKHNIWVRLINDFSLSPRQVAQLQEYLDLLVEWNEKFNLTAIVEPGKIALYHFYDSLALAKCLDFSQISSTADVGTGGGFPAIPLKILFPHLTMVLIEVNGKKRMFLEHIIQKLQLNDVILYPHDWRTFLRSTSYEVDCFFARASLQPQELIRIFKPSTSYHSSGLVYWASQQWVAGKQEELFIEKEVEYGLPADIKRKYVFFRMK